MPRRFDPSTVDVDKLKEIVRGFVELARTNELTKLNGELELAGNRLEVTVVRELETGQFELDDNQTVTEYTTRVISEHVNITAGPPNSPNKVVVAMPASWL